MLSNGCCIVYLFTGFLKMTFTSAESLVHHLSLYTNGTNGAMEGFCALKYVCEEMFCVFIGSKDYRNICSISKAYRR